MYKTIHVLEYPYFEDGASCFSHFAALPYAIFLDGGQPSSHAQYNIIVANPTHVFRIEQQDNSFDLFDALQHALNRLQQNTTIPEIIAHLPFTIGAVGYISYDYARRLYPLSNKAQSDIDLPDAIFAIYEWSIVIDHREKKTWIIARSDSVLQWITQQLCQPISSETFTIHESFQSNLSFAEYADRFIKIKHHIRHGDCYQINFCQRFSAPYSGSTWAAYQQIRKTHSTPFSAYLNLNGHALLSFSPERFLQVRQGYVETKPIKGTIGRSTDPVQDQRAAQQLLASEKDLAENIMIVDLLRNDLGKCCRPGTIRVPKLAALESFPNVHHLVSTIVGQLNEGQSALHLLKHCFPGGSITGAPKQRAMQIIDILEPHRRSAYCGTIAYIDIDGDMDSQIIIRTFIANANRLYCYAGGAIVADSDVHAEYEESNVKVKKLIDILVPPITNYLG